VPSFHCEGLAELSSVLPSLLSGFHTLTSTVHAVTAVSLDQEATVGVQTAASCAPSQAVT
jgi:hypothetical protein